MTGTDEIVSPLWFRDAWTRLLVDEGSEVERPASSSRRSIRPVEPSKAARDAAADNIRTLQARVLQSSRTLTMNDQQTLGGDRSGGRVGDGCKGPTTAGASELGAQ